MARAITFNIDKALDRARDIFWRQGYSQTSLPELLDAMEIKRSSFYNTFGDKQSVFMRTLNRASSESRNQIVTLLEQEGSPKAAIETTLKVIADDLLADADHKGCYLVNSLLELGDDDPAVRQLVAETMAFEEQAFAATLKRASDAGELRIGLDHDGLATFLVNTLRGMRVLCRQRVDIEQRLLAIRRSAMLILT